MSGAIAVYSRKGGVGKTVTAVNLAASFALSGHRTLLMDLDPRKSAAFCAGRHTTRPGLDLSQAVAGTKTPRDILADSCISLLKVVCPPDDIFTDSRGNNFAGENRGVLKRLTAVYKSSFDLVVMDLGPDRNAYVTEALCAADSVLIPLQCEYLAFKNLAGTIETLKSVKRNHHPGLRLCGILLTMADNRGSVSHRILAAAGRHLKGKLFHTIIPRSGCLRDSPAFRKPAVLRAPESDGARSYMALAMEILSKNRERWDLIATRT